MPDSKLHAECPESAPHLSGDNLGASVRSILSFRLALEDPEDFLQALTNFLEVVGAALLGKRQAGLHLRRLGLGLELLPRAGDGEAFRIQQLLNVKNILDVALAVHALTGAALYRLQLRELALPEAQHVCRKLAQFRNFTNPEIQF